MNVIYPFFGMMLLTMAVWVYMYYRRFSYMNRHHIEPRALATTSQVKAVLPPKIELPAENLANLFELPVLFYAVCIYLYATNRADGLDVILAWFFFVGRLAHSVVHCTYNQVMQRFLFYLLSSLALWALIIKALWELYIIG